MNAMKHALCVLLLFAVPLTQLVLCGCATHSPAESPSFKLSDDKGRTHETTDVGVRGFWYGFDTYKKESKEECVRLAQQMIAESKSKKPVDYVKVFVESPKSGIPYFRYCWARPEGVKTGEYEKYVVEQIEYDN